MHHGKASPHHEFSNEIPVTDAPHAILRDALETELTLEELAVDAERVASEGAAA